MAVGTAASANAVLSYFGLTHVTGITNFAVRRLATERPASPPATPENQGYFRGPVNVARVQASRAHHLGYWRKGRGAGAVLQDVSMAQPIGFTVETTIAAGWS
jgi:hypothetical protein